MPIQSRRPVLDSAKIQFGSSLSIGGFSAAECLRNLLFVPMLLLTKTVVLYCRDSLTVSTGSTSLQQILSDLSTKKSDRTTSGED